MGKPGMRIGLMATILAAARFEWGAIGPILDAVLFVILLIAGIGLLACVKRSK
jgi:hypothetical protein